jgi:hypothetical protein
MSIDSGSHAITVKVSLFYQGDAPGDRALITAILQGLVDQGYTPGEICIVGHELEQVEGATIPTLKEQ